MVRVELTSASNGIIKRVVDDNYNGAGAMFTVTKLYTIEKNDPMVAHQSYLLLSDLVNDLGVDVGPDHGHRLDFRLEWGDSYIPSLEELAERIGAVKAQLKMLTELQQELNPKPTKSSGRKAKG